MSFFMNELFDSTEEVVQNLGAFDSSVGSHSDSVPFDPNH